MEITFTWNTDNMNGLAAVIPTASKNDVTPVICGVFIDGRAFTTTDRYAVAEWAHGGGFAGVDMADTVSGSAGIIVPMDAAKWLAKQTLKALLGAGPAKLFDSSKSVEVAVIWPEAEEGKSREDAQLVVRHKDGGKEITSLRFFPILGNFPAVARLFPADDAEGHPTGEISLKPAFLKRASEAAGKVADREEGVRMKFTGSEHSTKPGPVLFSVLSAPQFKYLLQPNLLLR